MKRIEIIIFPKQYERYTLKGTEPFRRIMILVQTHKNEHFAIGDSFENDFIRLKSVATPEISSTFYVRGYDESRDKYILEMSEKKLYKVILAIKEYNKVYA